MSSLKKLGFIASGAYISESLAAEFGRIPPCLLPLGNEHLLYHQFKMLSKFVDEVYVSLPKDFTLNKIDRMRIEKLGIHIITCDPNSNIGEAISGCIRTIGDYNSELYVLFGDTLFTQIEQFHANSATVHLKKNEYRWANLEGFTQESCLIAKNMTFSGLFSFRNITDLLSCICKADGDYLEALRLYDKLHVLRLLKKGEWFDFGHVQTYFSSASAVTTQRSFNALEINPKLVTKSSQDKEKINSEAEWYINLPDKLKFFTPVFLRKEDTDNSACYSISNMNLATLSNLSVFGNLDFYIWDRIFSACSDFLSECSEDKPNVSFPITASEFFHEKTHQRLEQFGSSDWGQTVLSCKKVNDTNIPDLAEMLAVMDEIINNSDHGSQCIMHGDFCFSNIFFDFRSSMIKVIDPRGQLPNGTRTIFGLQTYDFAKLGHSALGGYDAIVSNYLPSQMHARTIGLDTSYLHSNRWQTVVRSFHKSSIYMKCDNDLMYAMIVNLFLSMIPLHADQPQRQLSIYARAIQLYREKLT